MINATAAVAGGSVTYLLNLLPALAEVDRDNEYVVLLSRFQNRVHFDLPSNFQVHHIDFLRPQLLWRLAWEQLVLPFRLVSVGADVLYAPMDIAPLLATCPVVLAVRNPNPYYEVARNGNARTKYRLQKWASWLSVRKASQVIFVSNYSRDTMAPQLGLSLNKTQVVYHGLDHTTFNPENDFPVPSTLRSQIQSLNPFVLCVSTVNPHKNYETLLRGWARLGSGVRNKYKLVIAGRRSSPIYFDRLTELVGELDIGDTVFFLGEVPYKGVPHLYRRASVFVLPSILETFGHPLVEAMAMQVPIVAASSTCIPEIVGDSALLFEPKSPADLSLKLEQVLTDREQRRRLVAKGQDRARDFSWEKTARKTLAILEACTH